MKEYLKALSKTNEIIVGNSVNPDELNRFSKSDFRWADNRKKSFQHRSVKKGEIYQFEYGKNYIPEMSYEHRGLMILKLNDIRTVSINRVLYQQSGRIDPSSATYKGIESLVLQKYFPSFLHDYENNKKVLDSLNDQISALTEDKKNLEVEVEKLKSEVDSLHNKLESSINT